jgi:transposase InsO family protein
MTPGCSRAPAGRCGARPGPPTRSRTRSSRSARTSTGTATIAAHLQRRHGSRPAVSTIWRILTARGFVIPQPHKRPQSSYVRFAAAQPNERWQTDLTHWTLADGTDAEICNWLDDHSRYCLASTAARVFTASAIDAGDRAIAAEHGDPAGLLTDNGAVFTGRFRGGGRVVLEVTLHARGVVLAHSRSYHPQTCGKVERFHQTLKKWLASQPAPTGSTNCRTSWTASAPTTTTSGRTARWAGAPRPRPTPPGPRPPRRASR